MARKQLLDPTDVQLLAHLYANPNLNNKTLAEAVGLAPSSCHERVKRLYASEVIRSSMLQVDHEALGGHIQAMVAVRLSNHDRDTIAGFQADLLDTNEVVSLYHTGGENDFLLHVSVPNALHLRDFVFDAITARTEVNHVETALVYDVQVSQKLPHY
ncbi:Lrp/AsnC family transcriptional regulator [Alteromonas sp. ASW11-36]|uniref:Lrp/AsnC family transcriptional regulator n=1 Tax=Alteromonas arenosi TaxID=3055817 RepID=A0ABT7T023_9ALTE|nr:Lrp/AsnC family transcriptional regulator [Alteromonas sp. ASW11-36]MDM7861793.1 Lrp/AsnC family transcriptional regulator [Alteromonas sp. ASW11-36]